MRGYINSFFFLFLITSCHVKEEVNQLYEEPALENKLREAEQLKHSETIKSKELAEEVLQESNLDKYKIRSAIVIGHILTNRGDFHGAKSIIDQAIALGQDSKENESFEKIVPYLANVYLKFGKIDEAFKIYKKLENDAKNIGYMIGVIMANTGIGICLMYFDPYDSFASYHFHKALDLARETNNIGFQGFINNNLGRLYLERKEYKKAINYLTKSMPLFEEVNNIRSLARSLLLIA